MIFEINLTLFLIYELMLYRLNSRLIVNFYFGIYARFVLVNTKNTHMAVVVQLNEEWILWTHFQGMKVQLKPEDWFRVVKLK